MFFFFILNYEGYHGKRLKGAAFPEEFGSIIIDWLTTKRFPHNAVTPKKWLMLKFHKFETCVVKNHSLRKFSLYPFLPVYNFDANMNISIIHHHLTYWRNNFVFPPVIYIQVFLYSFFLKFINYFSFSIS